MLSLKDRFMSSKIIYQKNVCIIFWTKITNKNVVMKILVNFGVRKSLKHNFWIALCYFLGSVSINKNPYYFHIHGYPPCLSVLHPHSIPSQGCCLKLIFINLGILKCHAYPETETLYSSSF